MKACLDADTIFGISVHLYDFDVKYKVKIWKRIAFVSKWKSQIFRRFKFGTVFDGPVYVISDEVMWRRPKSWPSIDP